MKILDEKLAMFVSMTMSSLIFVLFLSTRVVVLSKVMAIIIHC